MTTQYRDGIEIREMYWYEMTWKNILQLFGKLKPDVKSIKTGGKMYKRKLVLFVLIAMVLSSCASMANLQESWNKLSPDGKARIIASGFQTQLDTLFDTGKAYVVANPDKQTVWKTQAVPAFDTCNKALRVYMIGNTTPEEVYNAIPPLLESVVKSLKAMGVSL